MRRIVGLGSRERGPTDFAAWLLGTLERRYHIPEAVGRALLDDDRLILLLDGLDEVRESHREQCVRAINDLQERHGVTRLAVCCRVADYQLLSEQLRLQGAVEIRLLTREQVDGYLRSINPRLSGVAAALAADEELWELLTTPLMLTVMVIAEEGRTVTALAEGADAAERRRLLFDAYVVEVLARHRRDDPGDPERTLRALRVLASASTTLNRCVRVVPLDFGVGGGLGESIYNAVRLWLIPVTVFLLTIVPAVVLCLLVSASAGRIVTVFAVLVMLRLATGGAPDRVVAPRPWPLACYVVVVTSALAVVTVGAVRLVGLWENPRPGLISAVAVGLAAVLMALSGAVDGFDRFVVIWTLGTGIVAAVGVLVFGVTGPALGGWAVGLVYGTCVCVMMILDDTSAGTTGTDDAAKALSLRRRLVGAYAVVALVLPWLVNGPAGGSILPTLAGYVIGVVSGLGPALATENLVARAYFHSALAVAGEGDPWRRAFLRFAADRTLLTVVDSEYRFVHLLVRDHLASCDPGPLAAAVLRRRTERVTV